jgi:hypothetical protein
MAPGTQQAAITCWGCVQPSPSGCLKT